MVIHGSKDIENRSWVNAIVVDLITKQQSFAVHAARDMTRDYYRAAVEYAASQDPELVVPRPEELVFGAVLEPPDRGYRLSFRPQAIYFDGHSLFIEMRGLDVAILVAAAESRRRNGS